MHKLSLMLILLIAIQFSIQSNAEESPEKSEITCDKGKPCWICDASQREKGRMWCKEHDRYEDRCWICHPEMQDKKRLYCKEHGVYEDECTLCHPELKKTTNTKKFDKETCKKHHFEEAACIICTPKAREKGRLWCKEHSRYEDRCWICHPELEDKDREYCKEHHLYEDECIFCKPKNNEEKEKKKDIKKDKEAKVDAHKHDGPACDAHKIPKSACVLCNPDARQKKRLWCKEHTRYEDRCWLCHPDMQEKDRPYCKEHFLYEDECFYCNPELLKKEKTNKGQSHIKPEKRLECREHAVFEDECAICHPELTTDLAAGEDMKIRFISKHSAGKAGVSTEEPIDISGAVTRKAYAELSYNRNMLAMITPLTDGVITRIMVDVGDKVEANSVLAEVSSNTLAEAKHRYLEAQLELDLAHQEHVRQQELKKEQIAAERDVQQAKTEVARKQLAAAASAQALFNLGLNNSDLRTIKTNNDTSATLLVRAPFAGTIVDRTAVQGAAVKVGTSLMQLADLTTMWIELSISEDALQDLQVGQSVNAQFPALGESKIHGAISWIASHVDKRTRMVRARATINNSSGLLRSGLYGEAIINISSADSAMGVPHSAIQQFQKQAFVFVQQDADLYLARRVDLGPRIGEHYLVRSGLTKNDAVVTTGTHVVYSEMLKSRLGAGCVDD